MEDSDHVSILSGARVVYYPRDNYELEFHNTTTSSADAHWIAYVGYAGVLPDTPLLVKYWVTYEVMPHKSYNWLF
jgi:hypothetical protein